MLLEAMRKPQHFSRKVNFLCFVDRVSLYHLVNKTNLVHSFSQYICIYQSLYVSGDHGPIIRRYNCVYATLGTCYSLWMTVWYAGWNSTLHTKLCTKLVLFTRLGKSLFQLRSERGISQTKPYSCDRTCPTTALCAFVGHA